MARGRITARQARQLGKLGRQAPRFGLSVGIGLIVCQLWLLFMLFFRQYLPGIGSGGVSHGTVQASIDRMNASFVWLYMPLVIVMVLAVTIGFWLENRRVKQQRELFESLVREGLQLTTEEVLGLANEAAIGDFTGIYIIQNSVNGKYYVGQSIRVLNRLKQHFSGNGGNPDVFADNVRGDAFTIRTVSLQDSGYNNLNDLERDAIETYEAFTKGYNRTRGNHG